MQTLAPKFSFLLSHPSFSLSSSASNSLPSFPPFLPPSLPLSLTRYQFYQQTKRDLLQGKLPVDTAIRAARICGLMAQVDHGDYKPDLVYRHTITVQGAAENLEARTKREHQKLAGLSTEIAIEKFLSEVAGLPLYGVELYGISGGQYLGVGPEYITIFTADKTTLKQ